MYNNSNIFALLIALSFTYCSFCQGDVFVVDNEIENDWLWVTAQKNKERGLVPTALVEDAVSIDINQLT